MGHLIFLSNQTFKQHEWNTCEHSFRQLTKSSVLYSSRQMLQSICLEK